MSSPDPVGTLQEALTHTARLLESEPVLAAEQAREILKAVPEHPQAMLLLGVACRRSGDLPGALAVLRSLAKQQPRSAQTHHELGLTLGAAGESQAAIEALRNSLGLKPDNTNAWRSLGDHLAACGDTPASEHAYGQSIRYASRNPRLLQAGAALVENRIAMAESMLREYLQQYPTDAAAIRMLAEVASRLGRYGDAENLLTRALELAPGFIPARHNYAFVLHRSGKSAQALAELDRLMAIDARNPAYRNLKAAVLARVGDAQGAIELYQAITSEYPNQPKVWLSLGHALKTAGNQEQSVAAYRRCIELSPQLGEAWWSLANLKTVKFNDADIEAMQAQLRRDDLTPEDRYHFHFALGKALEDARQFAPSFDHYSRGNALRREVAAYDARDTAEQVQRSKALFTPDFLAARAGSGCTAADPIFIVGLPRSGSTLLEQILGSHPLVEGTQELPDLGALARELGGKKTRSQGSRYPQVLTELSLDELRTLGERYLEQTRIQRKTDAPFFIDKMPNNWLHAGLIHLILPNAKIIDARRHPLGCCFSGFKQHFARGQHFTYGLEDIGHYYRDYVEFMAHLDAVMPGRVHRVIYEKLIDHTEAEVRSLLDYCGLQFDERCLRFYENERAVRTASSEQVRQPIYRDGVDHWRNYEPWLGPLRRALGPVLDAYPAAPAFAGGGETRSNNALNDNMGRIVNDA